MAKQPKPAEPPTLAQFNEVLERLMRNCEHGSDRWLLLKMIQLQQELNTLVLESLGEIRHVKRDVHEIDEDVDKILEILTPEKAVSLTVKFGGK